MQPTYSPDLVFLFLKPKLPFSRIRIQHIWVGYVYEYYITYIYFKVKPVACMVFKNMTFTIFSHLSSAPYEYLVEVTFNILRLSTNWPSFWYRHMLWSPAIIRNKWSSKEAKFGDYNLIECFQVGFDNRCNLLTYLIMRQDIFIASGLAVGALFRSCLVRPSQLCSIESNSNGFVRFEQLKLQDI